MLFWNGQQTRCLCHELKCEIHSSSEAVSACVCVCVRLQVRVSYTIKEHFAWLNKTLWIGFVFLVTLLFWVADWLSIWNIWVFEIFNALHSYSLIIMFIVLQQTNAWWKLKTIVKCPLVASQRRRLSWVQLAGHKGKTMLVWFISMFQFHI